MDHLLNALAVRAGAMDASRGQARWGTVQSVDPARHLVRVALQPEGVLTGWLPLATLQTGAGWGIVAAPVPGQQALVVPDCGDHEHGVVVGFSFSDANQPPQPGGSAVQPGEWAAVHKSGSYLHFTNDGDVVAVTNRDLTATVGRNVTATVTGDVTATISGNLSATVQKDATISATGKFVLNAASIALNAVKVFGGAAEQSLRLATEDFVLNLFNTHTHSGVQTGGGSTGAPVQQAGDSHLTTNLTAV